MFTGCKSAKSKPQIKIEGISFAAHITYQGANYVADCTVENENSITAVITEPESLSGLTVTYNGNNCLVRYGEMEINNAERFLPQSCSIEMIKNVFSNLQSASFNGKHGNYEFRGDINGHGFIFITTPAGLPVSLQIEDYQLTVDFRNVTCK